MFCHVDCKALLCTMCVLLWWAQCYCSADVCLDARPPEEKIKQMAKKELRKTSAMSEEEERQISDVWSLNLKDRWRMYR